MTAAPPPVEWLAPPPGNARAAMFDFDGTVSLLREDWPEIMGEMMVDRLRETGTAEPPEALRAEVDRFIMQLNGKPTIHQMNRLVEEVAKRGGTPHPAEKYKEDYWKVLLERAGRRMADRGHPPASWAVPGCLELLHELRRRNVAVYLVSGSEWAQVCNEAEFLGAAEHFGGRIFGPRGDRDGFLKSKVVSQILAEQNIAGSQLVGFGDGVVETEDIRKAGGYAVGIASRRERDGQVHADKRERLIAAGAQMIVPDYAGFPTWIDTLFAR